MLYIYLWKIIWIVVGGSSRFSYHLYISLNQTARMLAAVQHRPSYCLKPLWAQTLPSLSSSQKSLSPRKAAAMASSGGGKRPERGDLRRQRIDPSPSLDSAVLRVLFLESIATVLDFTTSRFCWLRVVGQASSPDCAMCIYGYCSSGNN
jgi:hypothetical protein